MERRKWIQYGFSAAIIVGLISGAIFKFKPSPEKPEESGDPNAKLDAGLETNQNSGGASESFNSKNDSSSSGETVVNSMTGAVYLASEDPEGQGRSCLKLGAYTESNPQTVVGATTALGSDPGAYRENPPVDVTVYGPDGSIIGSLSTANGMPDSSVFSVVPVGTSVCQN